MLSVIPGRSGSYDVETGGSCPVAISISYPAESDDSPPTAVQEPTEVDNDQKISVKERMQKFNRLAESDMKIHAMNGKKRPDRGVDDDDAASVTTLDAKSREWLVLSSQADYQALAKLATENPRLARFKDPTSGYTALHWAAKHGNQDVVKLIAGTYAVDVNIRTNGGYTPLHIAMQFGHEEIYNLLVKVYGADPNIRDWSGRKPRQYQASQDTSVSADTFRRIVAAGTLRQVKQYRRKTRLSKYLSLGSL